MTLAPALRELEAWLARQEVRSRARLAACVSHPDFTHERPEFGQVITARPGSVIASAHRARWDPAPDYAWHWVRDAGVVMRLAPVLARDDPGGWARRMAEYAEFSLGIATRPGPSVNPLRATTIPSHRRFLRPDAELAALRGPALLGEPRANLDGSVDGEDWSRPQHDGPALRALSLLALEGSWTPAMEALLALDLDHTCRVAATPCIGPWEEPGEEACHAFTLLAQRAALDAAIAKGRLRRDEPRVREALGKIAAALDGLWDGKCIRSHDRAPEGESDAAVILGVLLGNPEAEAFGPGDARVVATLDRLWGWSEAAFPVNAAGPAPAIGRGPADRYFGGNPWVPTTLGVAEYFYLLAGRAASGAALDLGPLAARLGSVGLRVPGSADDPKVLARCLAAAGNLFLATIARHATEDGRLPEQIDRASGAPVSCPDLTWSHAALVSALEARRAARTGCA